MWNSPKNGVAKPFFSKQIQLEAGFWFHLRFSDLSNNFSKGNHGANYATA